jgi:hypothetical protein
VNDDVKFVILSRVNHVTYGYGEIT